jgi:hypothetical protein
VKGKGCGHCVVSVLTVINRLITNVVAKEADTDEYELLQPRTDCDVEDNSTLSSSSQHPVLKDPQSVMRIKPTSAYEGM